MVSHPPKLLWLAVLVAMNLVLLPDVQRTLPVPATGLEPQILLALGTFVAGVLVSWRICVIGVIGVIMVLCMLVIVWFKAAALFFILGVGVLIGITFWESA
jgi:hypothetical protein